MTSYRRGEKGGPREPLGSCICVERFSGCAGGAEQRLDSLEAPQIAILYGYSLLGVGKQERPFKWRTMARASEDDCPKLPAGYHMFQSNTSIQTLQRVKTSKTCTYYSFLYARFT